MKKQSAPPRFAFINLRISLSLLLISAGTILALARSGPSGGAETQDPSPENSGIQFGQSYQNDVSPPLRDLAALWNPHASKDEETREAALNPKLPLPLHVDAPDPVVDHGLLGLLVPEAMPAAILNFDGIPYPGVACSCHPPDTNGVVGATQYVQIVNEGYQVFNKTTGGSVLGPAGITTLWSGFGGVCQTNGAGDPVVLYDHLANRWVITQFAGTSIPTTQCIAVSTTSDATGTYNRYAFLLGSNFFDYPKLSVWPDGYYMAMNVFNSSGTAFLGPQAFAFDRANMLLGNAATFVTPGITGGSSEPSFLPGDLDGSIMPTSGVGDPFVSFPGSGTYKVRLFHADFVTPANTTFTQIGAPAAAGFTSICPSTRSCVPESGGEGLDAIGDRLMFRAAYRKFADGHESIVSNYTVSSGGVAGVRWFELRGVTTSPVVFQESTYQPDALWRWMGSVAMDQSGNIALGYSASSASTFPNINYAGRLASDPLNTLGQGEATLVTGTGSQSGGGNRWGDYSDMTIDPVDDCTFWYTQEYYGATGVAWRTRIGNFKFTQCTSVPTPVIVATTRNITAESCPPANNVIDPNETVTVNFCVQNGGTAATTSNLTGTLQNTGGVTGASGPQIYGAMNPGDTVCQPFSFTATGSCGGTLTATIHFQDGANDLGNVTYTFTLGVLNTITVFTENFDGVTAPALPAGWVASNASGTTLWVTSTTSPNTAPNVAFVNDPTTVTDRRLDSPTFTVPNATTQVSFRNSYNLESTFDGGVLEISSPNIAGGAFTDITNAAVGGSFVTGGYNGTLNTGSALAGRSAWTGNSGGYITTLANLGPNVAGQTIKLRFREATDTGTPGTPFGWRVDTIVVSSSSYICCGASTPTPTATATATSTATATFTPTATATATFTATATATFTPTATATATFTPTATATATATIPVPTPTPTPTPPCLVSTVSLPVATVTTAVTTFVQAVTTTNLNSSDNLVGFQGDFTFDETVVTFQNPPVSGAGLTSTNWNVSGNVQPGGGPIRTLRISAFSNDFTPLSGSGVLFNLNMTRVSSTPGANTALTWVPGATGFIFIDADLNSQTPCNTPAGSITIQAGTFNISGATTYCSNPSVPPVPGVTLTLTGTSSGSATSDGSGNYTLSAVPSGGNYTVTPSKATLPSGSAGITTVDVVAIQRHFLGIGVPLSGCRFTAADVNNSSTIDTVDVIATQRFFLGLSTGLANVGKYQFAPVNRTYSGTSTDQTGQNYDTLIFGDVTSPFVH